MQLRHDNYTNTDVEICEEVRSHNKHSGNYQKNYSPFILERECPFCPSCKPSMTGHRPLFLQYVVTYLDDLSLLADDWLKGGSDISQPVK